MLLIHKQKCRFWVLKMYLKQNLDIEFEEETWNIKICLNILYLMCKAV